MRVLRMAVLVLRVLFLAVGIAYAQTVEEYCHKAVEYGAQGKFEEAEKEFRKALAVDRFFWPAEGGLKLTKDVLEKRVESEVAIYLFKGAAYYNKGMLDEAIAEYKKALAINPNFAEAHYNLGAAYAEKGMLDEAIAEYKKALAINPNDAEAHNNLATAYYDKRQYGLAIEHCDRAIELGYKVHPEFLELLRPYRK